MVIKRLSTLTFSLIFEIDVDSFPDFAWCECYLEFGQQRKRIGAEALHIVADHLLTSLARSKEEIIKAKSGLDPKYRLAAFTLSDGHATIYIDYFDDKITLDFMDANMSLAYQGHLNKEEKEHWIDEIQSLQYFSKK